MTDDVTRPPRAWWRNGVVYQIYPRSWADSNGDGIGDIGGVISHLDHLEWLGVDAIWMNPITPSPNADWGYDVSDYRDVHPELGTLEELDVLIKEARTREIDVILDLVPNHTSDQHPWFQESRQEPDSPKRDWYVWHPGRGEGKPPNNWVRAIGRGPAWTLDEASGEYYMHSFTPEQPDLNWWNEDVRLAFDEILRFWFDRGVAGFRIDVVHALIHDPDLRGNPPVTDEDHPQVRRIGQRQLYNMNRPEVHDIIRRWRGIANAYSAEKVLIGETYLFDLAEVARYYGDDGQELHLAFNFPFLFADLDATQLAGIVDATIEALPPDASAAWSGSNHDAGRFITRWCRNDERRGRAALMLLLTLPGVCFLYYGDEIGMPQVTIPRNRLLDPAGIDRWPAPGRDGGRTPMQWSSEKGAGFTDPGIEPWLPLGDATEHNVDSQRRDPESLLYLTRQLIDLRSREPDLATGPYERLLLDDGVWGYRRGDTVEVWLNLSDTARSVRARHGVIVADTDPVGSEREATGEVVLQAWQGVVIAEAAI